MRKKRKSTSKIWLIVLILVLLTGGGFAAYRYYYLPSQKSDSEEATIQTAVARRGEIVLYASGSGTLIPSSVLDIGFDVSDGVKEELVKVLMEVGDRVEKGQVLARLDDSDRQEVLVEAQRDLRELTSASTIASLEQELAQTKTNLEEAQSKLMGLISLAVYRAEQTLEEYTQDLAEAKTAAEEDPSEEAEQRVAEAEQNLRWAEANYQAQQQYYEDEYLEEEFTAYYWDDGQKIEYIDAPTEAEIASVRAEISGYEARIEEIEILLSAIRGGEIPEDATGSRLAELRKTRQAVEDAQEDLAGTTLMAPIAGTITAIQAEETEKVGNEDWMTIADLTPPTLEAFFDESDWSSVQVGYPAEAVFDALPDKIFPGEVVHVDPELAQEGNTTVVRALVELDTSETGWDDLPVGSAAGVDVIGGKTENAVLVPVVAIREISEGEYAVFKMVDGEPRMQVVEVGLQDMIYAEILSGLEEGDVVTTGQVEAE